MSRRDTATTSRSSRGQASGKERLSGVLALALALLLLIGSPALGDAPDHAQATDQAAPGLDPALSAVVPEADRAIPADGLLQAAACSTAKGADFQYLAITVPSHWKDVVGEEESPLTAWYGEEQMAAKDRVQEWVHANDKGAMTYYLDLLRQSYVVTVDPGLSAMDRAAIRASLQEVSGNALRVLVQPACISQEEFEEAGELASKIGALGVPHTLRLNRSATKYEVHVAPDHASRARDLVPQGPAIVLVEQQTEGSLNDRMNDGSAHYGGARLTPYYLGTGYCTAGFTMVNGSSHRMITAGHCSASYPSYWSWYSGSQWFGGSESSYNWWNTRDIMLLGSTGSSHKYSRTIHVDPPTGDTRAVNSKGTASVDSTVCISGHVSKAKCGLIVEEYGDFSALVTGLVETYTGYAVDPLYRSVNQPGDSGAPIYQKVTSCDCARIVGMNIAEAPGQENTLFLSTSTIESAISPWKVKTSGSSGTP